MDPKEFGKLVKDALEHLGDTAYLEVHPLLSHLAGAAAANRTTRAQKLRSLLKESIESLRPPQGMPSRSPEWRSYLALRYRYVQDMSIGQVESEMGLSRRQLQREIQKGLEAVSSILWSRRDADSKPLPPVPTANDAPELESELSQWELARQSCEVNTLANDALGLLESTRAAGQAVVDATLPDSPPPVFVDSTLTRQALLMVLRLLTQHARGPVTLTAAPADPFVDLLLIGAGCGSRPAEIDWETPRLFIQLQGGTVSVEDQGEDWRVHIRLPMADQTRVLVIDDNPAILRLFERYLAPQHYEVLKAHAGSDALALAADSHPAVVLLDVMMPTMDGWQVLRSLKENPATTDTPVIICSVLKEPELAFSLGANAYLKKPVERLELLALVERMINPEARGQGTPPSTPPDS
jgi:CheY-like chemotaxis protein